jgi:hypothetical protein
MPAMTLPRFQFRLRTLLIAFALVGVACAVVRWENDIVRRRKAWIESNSATYSIKPVYSVRDGDVLTRAKISPNYSPLGYGLEYNRLSLGSEEDCPDWLRRLLGDAPIEMICIKENTSTAEIKSVVALFPEAEVFTRRLVSAQLSPARKAEH